MISKHAYTWKIINALRAQITFSKYWTYIRVAGRVRRESQTIIGYIDGLPELTDPVIRLRLLATAMRSAVYKQFIFHGSASVVLTLNYVILLLGAVGAMVITFLREASTVGALILTSLVFAGSLLLLVMILTPYVRFVDVCTSHLDLNTPSSMYFYWRMLLFFFAVSLLLMAGALLDIPDMSRAPDMVFLIALFHIVAVLMVNIIIGIRYYRERRRHSAPGPLDRIILGLLEVAYWSHWCRERRRWSYPRHIKALIAALERLGREAERFAVRRVPLWDITARRDARRIGVCLANEIRKHKASLAASSNGTDLEKISVEILKIVELWSDGSIKQLWEAAGEVTLAERVRRLAACLWPAIVLASMGFVLPLLPVFDNSQQAAQSVRITLVAAAVIALASGGVSVSERVNAVLDKSLPSESKDKEGD